MYTYIYIHTLYTHIYTLVHIYIYSCGIIKYQNCHERFLTKVKYVPDITPTIKLLSTKQDDNDT